MRVPTSPYAGLAAAVLCVSLGSILVRMAEAPPLAVAFYRVALAAAIIAPFSASAAANSWRKLTPRELAALGAAGVALGLHFGTWIASLAYTSVAVSVLLVNTAPLFTLVLARVFLREGVSTATLGAMGLALVGAIVIALGDWTDGPGSLRGAGLALAGSVTLSCYHVAGRGLRHALPLGAYVLAVWCVAAATLAVLAAFGGTPLAGYGSRTVAFLAALALIPTIGGHGLVNVALRRLPAPTVGLFLLGEPLGAAILAYFLFQEVPSFLTLVGGALILVALAGIVIGEKPPRDAATP